MDIQELIDNAVKMATTPIGGAKGITTSQRNLMGDVGQISRGLYNDQTSAELTKRGQDITSAGQNLSAETARRSQDLGFGLGKERLGMEKERYDIGNINAATSLLKPKKEIGGMGSVATSPSSLSTPSFSFSDWWNL